LVSDRQINLEATRELWLDGGVNGENSFPDLPTRRAAAAERRLCPSRFAENQAANSPPHGRQRPHDLTVAGRCPAAFPLPKICSAHFAPRT